MVRSRSRGWLGWIERVGNSLPDPVSLFLILIGLVMLFSALLAALGLEAVHPGTGEVIRVQNLFSAELLRRLFVEMPRTFAGFPPLGLVLVVMLGIGVADKSGLIAAALRGVLRRVPPRLLSAAVVFVGIMSSLAVDAGYVVVVPLGAFVFWAAGRHPLAGLAAAFAGVSGAFSANLFLTSLDPLLAGFTQSAAQLIDPDYRVPEVANYYFIVVLTPVLTLVGMAVTEWIVEPRLGSYRGQADIADLPAELGPEERRGLRWAAVALLGVLLLIGLLLLPPGAPLRGEDGSLAPFYSSIVALMFLLFLLPGLAYGIAVGRIRNDRDAVRMASEAMSDMALYIVLAFAAAHFIAVFNWSNLGAILAIRWAWFWCPPSSTSSSAAPAPSGPCLRRSWCPCSCSWASPRSWCRWLTEWGIRLRTSSPLCCHIFRLSSPSPCVMIGPRASAPSLRSCCPTPWRFCWP